MECEHKLRLLPLNNVVICEGCFEEWQPKAVMVPYVHVGDLPPQPDTVTTTTPVENDWWTVSSTEVFYASKEN